jgi:hypothetical protein
MPTAKKNGKDTLIVQDSLKLSSKTDNRERALGNAYTARYYK